MGVSLKPNVLGGGPSGNTPVGDWTSVDLLNELLIAHWGHERAYQRYGLLFSREVVSGNFMANLEQSGQLRECCKILCNGLSEGVLAAQVNLDSGAQERIPPDSWMKNQDLYFEFSFRQGRVLAGAHQDSPLKSMEGGVLLFEIEKSREWLSGLSSTHVLPGPLKRNPWGLRREPSVTLCEAISWLTDGAAKTASDRRRESAANATYFDERLSDGVDQFGAWDPLRKEFEYCVAAEMAKSVKIDRVRNILRDKIADGSLEAFGCYVDQGGREHGLSRVDPDFFLHSVGLSSLHDQTCVDPEAEHDSYREAREAGLWKSIRFRCVDLVRLFGSRPEVQVGAVTVATPKHPRMSVAEAKRRYSERVENWDVNLQPPTREDDEAWLKSELGVSRDLARKIRKEIAPENWQRGGRRKKPGGN